MSATLLSTAPDAATTSAATTSAATTAAAPRVIASLVLGELEVLPEQLLHFPEGLHGFPGETAFALVPAARDGFWWLQSAQEAGLAFLLVDPFLAAAGYELDLSEGDQQFLALTDPADALVLSIVTLPALPTQPATTNLRGPLVVNVATRVARQVVSRHEAYDFHTPIALPATSSAH